MTYSNYLQEKLYGFDSDINEVLNELRQRIESQDAKIAGLEAKMDDMEATHRQKETSLQERINTLEKTMEQPLKEARKQRSTIRTDREAPETEVAFYATHNDYGVHNLGANQILQFTREVTDIGNAFNNLTGVFVAPVAGTYVFHATVMGLDVDGSQHFRAHFDVDGTKYSVFWVSPYDQSSQMLVIDLAAGQTVTLRNDHVSAGFVGDHHSSFSGFLLYQNYPSGAVVGK